MIEPEVHSSTLTELTPDTLYEKCMSLARNLWWTWHPEVINLFRDLDPIRWRQLDHNPIALLREFTPERLAARALEMTLHSRINYAFRRLKEYVGPRTTWGSTHAGVLGAKPVAYFSAEFGIHESLPIYSGGLGVLSGDHIKSASGLGVPLVGIGLFYDQGYFKQHLDENGYQNEEYINVKTENLPIEPALDPDGNPITISLDTRNGTLLAKVWLMHVGRVKLYLLDCDVEGNSPQDRELTARLYGGDERTRIRQELVLGVGGVKALRALGITPGVYHLNEGHSAFGPLEVIRERMHDNGMTFDDAMREVAQQTVFTTHTPVPAGHDRFNSQLIAEHLGPLAEAIGLEHEQLMGLGRVDVDNVTEDFCMTVLALKSSRRANAVSALHGRVSRHMWTSLWPDRPEEETPIGHITNGVHVHTWLASQMHHLYDRYLGHDWPRRAASPHTWEPIEQVDDGELWETHLTLKSRLIEFVRRRAVRQAERRGEQKDFIRKLERALTPDALTIGFARRFATYKRANLALLETDTIAALVNDPQHPIQLVFAGKAHPRDEPGKRVLQQIARMAREPEFIGKIVFVEDYDINIGRHLTQGVDVWLNNPRRPLEASGTSGQKVVLNGGLNFSVLDGWWAEAYDGSNGFAIGLGQTHVDPAIHDARDAEALMKTLREQVIPLYYRRDESGLPRAWIARIKRAIQTLGWRFHSDRMVMDYVLNCYLPAVGGTSCVMPK
ncbi:MAG: alpha-glucan family phosphorylase [Planctomycetales bacterium]|nr:alpha-glucan family phosphorylase [Planctomycetales bacterium]